jgi:hypothetical protein
MSKMGLHCSFKHLETQVMAKRRVGSQITNLTSNQKISGINPIYLAANNMQHTLESY